MKVSKKSKRWRKELNQLRAMADVPWPARRFKIAPTFGRPVPTDRRCTNQVGERRLRRRGWRGIVDLLTFRRPIRQRVLCGAPLHLEPATAWRKRGRLVCLRCSPITKIMRQAIARRRRQLAGSVRGR